MHLPWEDKPETRNKIAMDQVYDDLQTLDPHSESYKLAVDNLTKLNDLQSATKTEPLNINTVVTVGAYVLVAGAVLIFEIYGHSITSKVMSVALPKPRI